MSDRSWGELARFATVVCLGFAVDIGVSLWLAVGFDLPLVLAAAVGFLTAACFNYVLHELWSFHSKTSRLSLRRLGMYLLSTGFALAVRLVLVGVASLFLSSELHALAVGAAVSLLVNYILSRRIVFRRAD
ncbi:GtrA family protein [Ruegeria sp. 2012CJ41-6]|uniref:GtrA family protein n=1 Tax=Ruegeria spongiae TaxID=2942209 RepID=A0ABT0Q603_9RHOB|nr:GtrA family protein [Ruegeria spongiae]MCL6285273.1 GtrA family protein [Ruegeria spongiae]